MRRAEAAGHPSMEFVVAQVNLESTGELGSIGFVGR
jgi:hypothetical protein